VTFQHLDTKNALAFISNPVTIITTNDGNLKNGMTAVWMSPISIEPPILCVSISPKRHTWDMLTCLEYFGVCQLAKGQEGIGMKFGTGSGRDADKFELLGMEPFMASHDVPLVPGSLAGFVCRKTHQVEQGDHWALFGEVVEAWKGDGQPLNWHRSKYQE